MYEERIISARDYQAQAVADTLAAFAAGEKGVMIRLPTGTGKTITAGLIVKDWLSRSPSHRVMVLCHEIQLIDQFAKELWDVTGHAAAIEQGSRRCAYRERRKLVVASRATLAERVVEESNGEIRRTSRLAKFDYRDHWLVVSDEAHKYSLGLKTCGHVFQWFEQNPESRRLGITATPWRMDGVSLGTLFPHVAVDYRLMTWDGTPNAVDDGWCVPYEQKYIVVEGVDFKQLNVGRGDWTDENVARLLAETRMLSKYVDPTLDLVGKRPTLIFCPTVDMAKMVSDYINARLKRDCSRQLDGSVSHDDRRLVYQQFEGGVFQFLVVCGLCIAKGSRILTDRGEVPIENVTTDMKVWDGVEFVSHDGVVSRGRKPVIEYAGLKATGDHHVWTKSGWTTLADCKQGGLAIAVAGVSGVAVEESEGYYRDGGGVWRCPTCGGGVPTVRTKDAAELLQAANTGVIVPAVCNESQESEPTKVSVGDPSGDDVWTETACYDRQGREDWHQQSCCCGGGVCRVPSQEGNGPERTAASAGWVSELREEDRTAGVVAAEMPVGEEEVPEQERSALRGLRRSRYTFPVRLCTAHGEVGGGEPWVAPRTDSGQNRQQRPLLSGEPAVRDTDDASEQPPEAEMVEEVFDILNAGPRHRFTANGLIVSNCREGYDNPSIGAVAIFRPTKSTSLLEQMCGRGCRPLRGVLDGKLTAAERKAAIAASAKPTCLIVNLTGSTGLAGAATTAKCYLEGQPDEVVARTEARMVKGETNIARAVEQVKQEIADEEEKARKRQEKLAKDRERRRLRAEQQAALDAQVQYSAHNISPYSGTEVQAANHGGALLATEKQLKVLWRAGISVDASRLSRRHASALVGMVINHKPREVIRKLARKFQDATPAPDIHVTVTRVQERQPPEAHSAPVEVSEAPRHDTGSAVQDRVQASQEPDWGQVFPLFRQR